MAEKTKTVNCGFTITAEQAGKIEQEKRETTKSKSLIVRQAIDLYFETNR